MTPGGETQVGGRGTPGAVDAELARRFGAFGGRYVPETLIRALDELEAEYAVARRDPGFAAELSALLPRLRRAPDPRSGAPNGSKTQPAGVRSTSSGRT